MNELKEADSEEASQTVSVHFVMDASCQTQLTMWSRLNQIEMSELGCLSIWKMKC